MKKQILLVLAMMMMLPFCYADEGMWIPMLLKKYNIEDMQKKGFKLTAEDVYNLNQASLKDAIIGLGDEDRPFSHFCTGEIVSNEGLVLTNHHCSFSMVQAHSTLEHNYIRDGFWAKSHGDELVNPGTTASILVRMEDVTEAITSQLKEEMTEAERDKAIQKISKEMEQKAIEGTNLAANIKPYFNGNQFFMSIFKTFKDVRLVGAPASAIGKFGGDTDNWVWPRHTGDFSVLRIYAGEDNEPAVFSEKNKPYRPATFLKISTQGVKEGDFTMVFGYPGTTKEYLPSYAVQQLIEIENPHKTAIRTEKLNIINTAMESDEALRIKYAAKAASVANSWKKWQGESKGLKRFKTVENKQKTEQDFQQWAIDKPLYNGLINRYKELYDQRKDLILAQTYALEAGKKGAEIIDLALSAYQWAYRHNEAEDKEACKKEIFKEAEAFYKDYDGSTDRKILAQMMRLYNANLSAGWIPQEVAAAAQKGDYEAYAAELFRSSILGSPERLYNFIDRLNQKSLQKLSKDPVYQLANSIVAINVEKISPSLIQIERELKKLDRLWLAGQMEWQPEKTFYADANSTLRVAYGTIGGYSPQDAVYYKHYTTLKGIMEKDNPDIYDYDVPQKLREVYEKGDFGAYTQNGEVPVCFIANNHTTGGNSGSPVLNADGRLIGINFDRAWEGVMSDIQYDPEICRNIAIDIRYVLFVIDKVAGASYLLNEMEIIP